MAETELEITPYTDAVQDGWLLVPVTKPWSSFAAKVDIADNLKLGLSQGDDAGYRFLIAFPIAEQRGEQPANSVTLDQLEAYLTGLVQVYARVKMAYEAAVVTPGADNDGKF